MDLTDCGKEFQAIADLCLNDSFPTLVLGLSRVSLKLSLILRKFLYDCCNLFRANTVVGFMSQTVFSNLISEVTWSKRVETTRVSGRVYLLLSCSR